MHFAICSSVLGTNSQMCMPKPQLCVLKSIFPQITQVIDYQIGLVVRAAETDNWVSMSEGTLHQGVGGSTNWLGHMSINIIQKRAGVR